MRFINIFVILYLSACLIQCGNDIPGTAGGKAVMEGPDALHRRGVALAESGSTREAMAAFTGAIRLRSDFAPAILDRGYLSLSEKKYAAARWDLERGVILSYKIAEAGLKRGAENFRAGNYPDAAADIAAAAAASKDIDRGYAGLAAASMGMRRSPVPGRVHPLASEMATLHFYRGICFMKNGRRGQALKSFRKALELKEDYPEAGFFRAKILAESGNSDDAIKELTGILKISPGNATARYNRGLAYFEKEMYMEALEDFSAVVKSNPRDADAYFNRAMTNSKLGNGEETLLDIKQAIKLNPRKSGFYNTSEALCPRRGLGLWR